MNRQGIINLCEFESLDTLNIRMRKADNRNYLNTLIKRDIEDALESLMLVPSMDIEIARYEIKFGKKRHEFNIIERQEFMNEMVRKYRGGM